MTFSLLNALAVAMGTVFAGIASRRAPVALVLALASPVALAVSLVAAWVEPSGWGVEAASLGLVAGFAGGLALLAAYRALAIGPVGMVAAIISCTATVVVAMSGFVLQERGGWLTWVAIAGCVVAIALVSVDSRPGQVRAQALGLAVLGGVGSGSFVVLMSFTVADDGWAPFVAVRVAVVVVAVLFAAASWRRIRRTPGVRESGTWWRFGMLAGLMDGLANITLILALRFLDLTTIAIVGAIIPALTALIGWVFLAERLRPTQRAGIALAVGALALHAIG